jgi:hypothetical protein
MEACEMSENLIQSVAPHLAPPVTRESAHSASDTGGGAELATPPYGWPTPMFADDEAE